MLTVYLLILLSAFVHWVAVFILNDRLKGRTSLAQFRRHLATIESERAAHQQAALEEDFARAKDPFYMPTPGAEGGER